MKALWPRIPRLQPHSNLFSPNSKLFYTRSLSTRHTPATLINTVNHNELEKHIRATIKVSGPMSVATYMRTCLLHPLHGYYMSRDVFGKSGDFTTSPEISPLFGEIIAVWFVHFYQTHVKKGRVNMVEIGPGRGTLMRDVLATIRQFGNAVQIDSVHLVEASPYLRQHQASLLAPGKTITDAQVTDSHGTLIHWHDDLNSVPLGTNFILAHEFFDALCVFKFEMTGHGWRELVVDYDDTTPYPN